MTYWELKVKLNWCEIENDYINGIGEREWLKFIKICVPLNKIKVGGKSIAKKLDTQGADPVRDFFGGNFGLLLSIENSFDENKKNQQILVQFF